jgi:hypothetical protein
LFETESRARTTGRRVWAEPSCVDPAAGLGDELLGGIRFFSLLFHLIQTQFQNFLNDPNIAVWVLSMQSASILYGESGGLAMV